MDYLALVKQKEEEQLELDNRMQRDSDLVYLKPYVMTDHKNRQVPDIVNVTLNKPAIFAAHVIAALQATTQQTIVESNNYDLDTHYIEDFQDYAFRGANSRLKSMNQPLLNDFSDIQFCLRGRMARRILFRMEDNTLIPDISQWDGRNVFYESGLNGLKWAANRTTRSKAQIESEYGIIIKGRQGVVLDVWDDNHNEVWIDTIKEFEQEHTFGYTPVVVQIVPMGYGAVLLDKDRLKNEGESIFFLIRDLVPELNRLASIMQTLNMKAVKPPMKFKNKEGKTATPPDYDDATDSGSMTSVDPEGDISPIDYGDAKASAQMLFSIMSNALAEGSLSSIDLGNMQFPLSAVALVTIGEGRDQVFLPRLSAKAELNQQTADMFTKQILNIGGSVELGTPGHKRVFDTSKINGEYETSYKYFVKSPKIDIARLTMAREAIVFGVDRETVYTDILQYEDPKGMIQKYYYEMAEKISPNVLKNRTIIKLLELAEKGNDDAARDAQIMAEELGMSLQMIKQGIITPTPTQEKMPAPMIDLMGRSGDVGGLPTPPTEVTQTTGG